MKITKLKKLETNGWKIGNATDFLKLTDEEAAYTGIKHELANYLKETGTKRHLTQKDFAKKIDSSQSRVAKMETCDHSVSLDLLIKSLLALGLSNEDIDKTIINSKSA